MSNYLIHHGVKGQQWGVQNGPPYPLDSSISTGSRLKETTTKVSNTSESGSIAPLAIILALESTPIAAAMIHDSVLNARAKKFVEKYQNIDVDTIKKESDLPKIKGEHSVKEDMSVVNNKGDTRKPERSHNCVLCSVAYDLRRKGYDVAAGETLRGITDSQILKMYKGKNTFTKLSDLSKKNETLTASSIRSKMESNTKIGEHGIFCCATQYYGSHCIAWEHTDKGVIFIDGQTNETYNNKELTNTFNVSSDWAVKGSPARYLTTSTLEVNTKVLGDNKYVKVRSAS